MDKYSVIPGFLSTEEQAELKEYFLDRAWDETEEEACYLRLPVPTSDLKTLQNKALLTLGVNEETEHDCFLIRYPQGCSIPPHIDLGTPDGQEQIRLNSLIQQAEVGGIFGIEGRDIPMFERDAIIYRSDTMRHRVTTVYGCYDRVIFSVGILKGETKMETNNEATMKKSFDWKNAAVSFGSGLLGAAASLYGLLWFMSRGWK